MQMMVMTLTDALQSIRRHKLVALLLIAQVLLCMMLMGNLLTSVQGTQQKLSTYQERYAGKTYYSTSECLSDTAYYQYLNDDGQGYQKLNAFANRLLSTNVFEFMMFMEQNIDLTDVLAEKFRYGYEYGDADASVYDYEGKTYHAMKCFQTSPKFFTEFGIAPEQGRSFEQQDYQYKVGKEIPVLLGHDYLGILAIGDTLHGLYLGQDMQFEVIGIVGADAYFFSRQQRAMVSCNRYIIMPAMLSTPADATAFNRIRQLQQMEGMIVSDQGYEAVTSAYAALMAASGIPNWSIEVRNPNANNDRGNILEQYTAMTDEVAGQFHIILGLVFAFIVLSMSLTISGLIREKKYDYGVRMLCGAPPITIWMNAFILTGIFVFAGSVLSLVGISNLTSDAFIILLEIEVGIWLISSILPLYTILHMKMTDMIGGKE